MQGHHNCDWNDFDSGSVTYRSSTTSSRSSSIIILYTHGPMWWWCTLNIHLCCFVVIVVMFNTIPRGFSPSDYRIFLCSFSHILCMCYHVSLSVCVCVPFETINDSTFTGQAKGAQYIWPPQYFK